MKKTMKMLSLLCALALMLTVIIGCGTQSADPSADTTVNDTVDTSGDQTEENNEVITVNAYTAAYDEVVALLAAEGISTDAPVDMNTTGGYWNDNMNGGLYSEAVVACDTAKDFGGVYLVWYNIDGSYLADWNSMKINGGAMVYAGGMYSLQLDSYKGMFALGFSAEASEDLKNKAKAAFDKLDTTVPEDIKYMTSVSEMALLLKDKGYVDVAAIGAMEDLNYKYYVEGYGEEWSDEAQNYVPVENYKYFAEFGTEAKSFGGITVFYYNLSDSYAFAAENLDYSGAGLAYKGLLDDNKVVGYVGDYNWVYTPYTENGAEVSYNADVICGSFAVSIDDSVANKSEIIDYLKSLAK